MAYSQCWGLFFLSIFVQPSLADPWCDPDRIFCNTTGNQLFDLSCGWCRSWTFASNIAGNKLRMVGLDGGALPGDTNATRDYLVEASLDEPFNLEDGTNWKLSLLPNGYPKLKRSALWSNPSNSTLFYYGGYALDAITPNGNDIPAFNIHSNQWSIVSSLIITPRLTDGASVNVPDLGKAFYVGGFQSNFTSSSAPNDGLNHYATAMFQFDTNTQTSSQMDAPFLPVQFGAVSYISTGTGALIYFGGESPATPNVQAGPDFTINGSDFTVNSWDYVWVYDIKGNKWFRQPTSGSVAPRTEFCTSTIFDPDSKTWQIWVIGGGDFKTKEIFDTVSILSIPSFKWFNAGPAVIRMATDCQRVGSQIFVIGGMSVQKPEREAYPAIAYVYDVNKQASVSTFVPTSTSYTAPSSIRAAAMSASTPSTWADPAVQSLFMSSSTMSIHHLSGGAIAGVVVGVILGLSVVIGSIMFWLSQRRKAEPEKPNESVAPYEKSEAEMQQIDVIELEAQRNEKLELEAKAFEVFELDAQENEKVELDALQSEKIELDAQQIGSVKMIAQRNEKLMHEPHDCETPGLDEKQNKAKSSLLETTNLDTGSSQDEILGNPPTAPK